MNARISVTEEVPYQVTSKGDALHPSHFLAKILRSVHKKKYMFTKESDSFISLLGFLTQKINYFV